MDANGWLTEIDVKAMRREAADLLRYIDEAPEAERERFQYDAWLRPLTNAALDGTLDIPYRENPYSFHLMNEGILPMLPNKLMGRYAQFFIRIKGDPTVSSCSVAETGSYEPSVSEVVIDGERYEWVIFED